MLRSVNYDPGALVQGPARKGRGAKADAAEALRALMTEQRQSSTYLEM
jgi:hypothetical protein